jgi:hypothetical protein
VPSTVGDGKSFTAVLDVGGSRKTFRGKMLSELFTQKGVQLGDRIAITPKGKTAVPSAKAGGATFTKNTFLVERAET